MLSALRNVRRRATQHAIDVFSAESSEEDRAFQDKYRAVLVWKDKLLDARRTLVAVKTTLENFLASTTRIGTLVNSVANGMPHRPELRDQLDEIGKIGYSTFIIPLETELTSIDAKLKLFDDLEKLVDDRKIVLLDYRAYGRKVQYMAEHPEKVDAETQQRRQHKYTVAKATFDFKDRESRASIAYLETLGPRIAEAELERMKQAMVEFYEGAHQHAAIISFRAAEDVAAEVEAAATERKEEILPPPIDSILTGVVTSVGNGATTWRSSMASVDTTLRRSSEYGGMAAAEGRPSDLRIPTTSVVSMDYDASLMSQRPVQAEAVPDSNGRAAYPSIVPPSNGGGVAVHGAPHAPPRPLPSAPPEFESLATGAERSDSAERSSYDYSDVDLMYRPSMSSLDPTTYEAPQWASTGVGRRGSASLRGSSSSRRDSTPTTSAESQSDPAEPSKEPSQGAPQPPPKLSRRSSFGTEGEGKETETYEDLRPPPPRPPPPKLSTMSNRG